MEYKLKVGDLVKWTNEGAEDLGIIIPFTEVYNGNPVTDGHVSIHWLGNPQHSGHYRSDHHYLELLSATS
jgi:hypothetical protein